MMWYYGGAGWMGWAWMGLSMLIFWGAIIFLLVWAVRSVSRTPKAKSSGALAILEERLARGDITAEEFAERKRLIQGG